MMGVRVTTLWVERQVEERKLVVIALMLVAMETPH
jgi:hypothetical protein